MDPREQDKEIRSLRRKLERSERNRANLERIKDDNQALLMKLNEELTQTLERLEEAQAELVLKEKMASLGQFVAGVAHEINTPIAAISSMGAVSEKALAAIADAIASHEELSADKRVRKSIDILANNAKLAQQAAERVTGIAKSLKNFVRLDEAELKQVDLNEGLQSSLALQKHALASGASVHLELGELPAVICYAREINQVFFNVVANAARAIGEAGNIWIETSCVDDTVRVTVRDDGVGIAPEDLERVFEPGFTRQDVGVGTGLGLATSYRIMAKHGGSIALQSELGEGTVCTLTIPLAPTLGEGRDPSPTSR